MTLFSKGLGRLFIAIAALFLFAPTNLFAAEVIRSFDSTIVVSKDGTFTVTETIQVTAEGRQIRRGIYRDFPLLFEDASGKRRKVGFKLVSVSRDGQTDGSRVVDNGDSVRIYVGNPDYFLPPGEYTYRIEYVTTRQVRFFDGYDEIYWNATGDRWSFPIQSASAKLVLPEGANVEETKVFTGRFGSTETAANVSVATGANVVRYTSSRTLNPGEGMTVLAKLTKGSIAPPSDAQRSAWFWKDNINVILGSIVLALVAFYYSWAWWAVGRDPEKGTIVPRWDVPSDLSPALINYIHKKGLRGRGFDAMSAAILNLAVKGFVTLDKPDDKLHIIATGKSGWNALPVGEYAILQKLLSWKDRKLVVSKSHGSKVKTLQSKFSSAMESEHRDKYYRHNGLWVFGGVVLSIIGIVAVVVFGDFSGDAIGALFGSGISTTVVTMFVLSLVRNLVTGRSLVSKIFSVIMAGVLTFVFLSGGIAAILSNLDFSATETWLITIGAGVVAANVIFYFLLGAPTPLGRKRMDEIDGLSIYLTLAEKDRMNLQGVPDFSVKHYEDLLPYAVALGVEKPWSKAFDTWLAAAVAAGAVAASYSPRWYRGRDFGSDSLSDTMGDFTDSMQSGFSTAMPVPKSSSSGFSGGGGSSGGGGGGGGGGGW